MKEQYEWTQALKRAQVIKLKKVVSLASKANKFMAEFFDVVMVGSLWMLGGAELAALLDDQADINVSENSADLQLGPTKTNPSGAASPRIL